MGEYSLRTCLKILTGYPAYDIRLYRYAVMLCHDGNTIFKQVLKDLGKRIQAARKTKNKTQDEVAVAIGVNTYRCLGV